MIITKENLLTTKTNKHTECGYSLFTHCSLDDSNHKHDFYISVYYMKIFSADLRKHAKELINYEKKEIVPWQMKRLNNTVE